MSILKHQRTINSFEYFKNIWIFFYGTLGTWNTAPVESELKDNAKTVRLQNYRVLRANEAMFRKELERLVKLGVNEEENESEWGAPSF